jgi:UDP-glucuronate 4-epimerase
MQMKSDFLNSHLTWLITRAAEFIGTYSCLRLLAKGHYFIRLDNLSNYHDMSPKLVRRSQLKLYQNFNFHRLDVMNCERVATLFESVRPQRVIYPAAQAKVRYFLVDPQAYLGPNRGSRVLDILIFDE